MGVNSPVRYYPPYPRFIRKAKGSRIWDVDEKEYIDFLLAYGPLILGHRPERVINRIRETLEIGTMFGAPTEQEVQFGEIFAKAAALDKIRFVNTGTEATMHSIRLAIHHTKRKKVLKIKGGYHGTHQFNFDSDYVESVEFNSPEMIKEKLSGGEFACLILEPVMGNLGVINPEEGYLEEVREITENTGTLLIIDEVITGFRTGFFPYHATKRIDPDLATYAKIIGGGLPLGAFGGKEEIMKEVRPSGAFPQAGTYSGNPVSVAAGLETLKILSSKDYSRLKRMTDLAVRYLSESGLTVNSQTGMLSLFFTDKGVSKASEAMKSSKELYPQFFNEALKRGVFLAPSYDETIFISFVHSESEVKETFQSLSEVAERLWKARSR
jgi:glutamate-1-semialdehyde 2,1-aminomutase